MKQGKTISRFLGKVRQTLEKYQMVESGETVIVATSGGLDSMALLDCLYVLREELGISLIIAHLDHGLRGEESQREYLFVQGQAAKYGIPFEGAALTRAQYPRGGSVQNEARILRYQFYEHVRVKNKAQKIALAHHRDDHIETIIMWMLRGTGIAGLKGIPAVREGVYIRPFIETTREEIGEFSRCRNILYMEDSSNRSSIYLRNRIRNELLPFLRERFRASIDSGGLVQMASILSEEDDYLQVETAVCLESAVERRVGGRELALRRSTLLAFHPAVQRRVMRMAYTTLGGTHYGPSYGTIEGLLIGAKKDTPHQQYCLPEGIHVYFEYDSIRFTRERIWESISFNVSHMIGSETYIPEIGTWMCSKVINGEVCRARETPNSNEAILSFPPSISEVLIRNFRPGDRFHPLGLHQAKKLKNFFIDEKVPRSMRYRIPLVEIGGQIAWVVGYRIDERYKVTHDTSFCVEFRVKRRTG